MRVFFTRRSTRRRFCCGASGSTGMYQPVLALMASGALDITPLISGRYPFKDILQGYHDMKGKNDIRIKWLVDFE